MVRTWPCWRQNLKRVNNLQTSKNNMCLFVLMVYFFHIHQKLPQRGSQYDLLWKCHTKNWRFLKTAWMFLIWEFSPIFGALVVHRTWYRMEQRGSLPPYLLMKSANSVKSRKLQPRLKSCGESLGAVINGWNAKKLLAVECLVLSMFHNIDGEAPGPGKGLFCSNCAIYVDLPISIHVLHSGGMLPARVSLWLYRAAKSNIAFTRFELDDPSMKNCVKSEDRHSDIYWPAQ